MARKKNQSRSQLKLQATEPLPGEHFKLLVSDEHSLRVKALVDKINKKSPPKPAATDNAELMRSKKKKQAC
jgi:hypothetical protein